MVVKVTVNLPEEQVEFLNAIAKVEGLTFTDVLRRAINSEKFFVDQALAEHTVLVKDKSGAIYETERR